MSYICKYLIDKHNNILIVIVHNCYFDNRLSTMYISVLKSIPHTIMGFNNTLNRLLTDPDSRERQVLEADILEFERLEDEPNDLDARIIGIHKNTNQRLIIVTQDKALLTLKRNIARLGKKEWVAPMSTLSTIMIALITSNFKYALGLGPAEWRAIFIVCGIISTGWLAGAVKRSIAAKSFHEVIQDVCFELGARPKPFESTKRKKRSTSSASSVIAACKTRVNHARKNARKKKAK